MPNEKSKSALVCTMRECVSTQVTELHRFTVRVRGISAPPTRKPRGQRAKRAAEEEALLKRRMLSNIGVNRHGRLIADVAIQPDNDEEAPIPLGALMLSRGLADECRSGASKAGGEPGLAAPSEGAGGGRGWKR